MLIKKLFQNEVLVASFLARLLYNKKRFLTIYCNGLGKQLKKLVIIIENCLSQDDKKSDA